MERGGTQTNKSVVNYFHSYDFVLHMSVWNLQIVLSSISFGLVAGKILRGLGQDMTMWFVFFWFLTSVFYAVLVCLRMLKIWTQ